jgi:hypothetical protein
VVKLPFVLIDTSRTPKLRTDNSAVSTKPGGRGLPKRASPPPHRRRVEGDARAAGVLKVSRPECGTSGRESAGRRELPPRCRQRTPSSPTWPRSGSVAGEMPSALGEPECSWVIELGSSRSAVVPGTDRSESRRRG